MTPAPRPTLTILVATRDRAPMLDEALGSLAPVPDDVEVVVLDAMSTDGTADVVAAHPDVEHRRAPDAGIYDAWNAGVAAARAPWVLFLNDDDLIDRVGLSRLLDLLRSPQADGIEVVHAGHETIDVAGIRPSERHLPSMHPWAAERLLVGASAINARAFRRDLLERVGPFDLELPVIADLDLLLRLAEIDPADTVLPVVLYRYREHAASLTQSPARSFDGAVAQATRLVGRACERGLDSHAGTALRRWWAAQVARAVMRERGPSRRALVRSTLRQDPWWPALAVGYGVRARARRTRGRRQARAST